MESLLSQKTITNKPTVSALGLESKNTKSDKGISEVIEVDPIPDWKSDMENFFKQHG